MQKQEKASVTLSLHQKIEEEVQEIEREIAQRPELDQIQVTEEMDQALLEKIRAFEKEMEAEAGEKFAEKMDRDVEFSDELVPDLDLLRKTAQGSGKETEYAGEEKNGKVVYRRKKRKYWVISLAAVLVIVLGVGMNSVGSKSYWKNLWQAVRGEPMNGIDVEDMNKQNTEDADEIAAYKEIKEKLNIKPVRIFYRPKDMKLIDYEIQEDILTAQLLYKYEDETIKYILYVSDVDSSWGQKEEDKRIDEYSVSINGIKINASEYQVRDSKKNRQMANFEYQGVQYQLKGVMERTEFEKILENLYFF